MLSEKVVPAAEGEAGGLKARLAARFKKRPEESPEKKVRLHYDTCDISYLSSIHPKHAV